MSTKSHPKMSMKCHQKCPRDVTSFVHEMSPIMSTRCLPPVAFSGGLKCPRKIFFNTQWGRGAVFLSNWRRCRGGKTSIAPSVKGAPRCCLDQPTTTDSGCKNASIKLRHRNTNCYTRGNFSREKV